MTPEQQTEWERLAEDPSMSAWNTVARATAFPDVVAALREAQARIAELRGDHEGGWFWSQAEWSDWSNTLARLLPEEYDGDEAQEAIIGRALSDLVARSLRLDQVIAALARWQQQSGGAVHPNGWLAVLRRAALGEDRSGDPEQQQQQINAPKGEEH